MSNKLRSEKPKKYSVHTQIQKPPFDLKKKKIGGSNDLDKKKKKNNHTN